MVSSGNDIFGCSNCGLVGKNLKDFTSDSNYDLVLDKTSVRKSGKTDIYELNITGCDKVDRTILVKCSPVIDDNGNYKGAFGLFTDITEHKKFEAKREMIIKELETKLSNGKHSRNYQSAIRIKLRKGKYGNFSFKINR